MFLTRTHLSRRAVLRGLGATVALPFLEAMIPARPLSGATLPAKKVRLVCIEMVHGSAGSSIIGVRKNLWAPAAVGRDFDLAPTSLAPLARYRDQLTIVSNTDCANADPWDAGEIGGDHFRSSAVFLTQAHPRRTQGADVQAGTSMDQLFAQRFGQETPIPSMQLAIEPVDQAGGCGMGYSCVYTDAISWAAPDRPLPMIRDPRVVFDRLFSVLRADPLDRSILDRILTSAARLRRNLGPQDRARVDDYLENVREVERRIQRVEAYNASGEPRVMPEAPKGVPDSFSDHVKVMFDLQALAFASDMTRAFAFKLGRDNSNRVYPESGFKGAFHPTSHHSGKEEKILNFARLNTFHVGLVPYLLDKLSAIREGEHSVLDNTLVLYGSSMGDSNQHNHKRVPFFVVGGANGLLAGGRHFRAPNGTPLADVMLSLLHALGHDDLSAFGDSEKAFDLNG